MTREQYLEKRNALLAEAQAFLNEGKVDESKAKMKEVEELDTKYDEIAKTRANMQALAGNAVVQEVSNLGVQVTPVAGQGFVPLAPQVVDRQDQYKTAFAKLMMGQRVTTEEQNLVDEINADFRKSNTTQTTTQGALLIPETVKEGIWKEIGEAHPIVADVAMTFVPGDFTIIKESSTSLSTDAAAYDEATEVGDSDNLVFGELNLTGCELAKAVTVSWKAKKMTVEAFLTYITTKIAEKMGNALAKWIVEGLGKPGVGDVFKAQAYGIAVRLEGETDTPQIVTYDPSTDPIDYTKMTSAMAKLKSGYLAGSAIYAKNDVIWNYLANITDEIGRPMFVPSVADGGVGKLFGLTVKEEDAVSTNEILIGNVKQGYVMNANENISMYQEDHVKARTTDYMGYAIIDGDVLTTKAFVLIKRA
jgi:HK97 family phage major capsid protein